MSLIEDDAVKAGQKLNEGLARMSDELRKDLDKARSRNEEESRDRKGH